MNVNGDPPDDDPNVVRIRAVPGEGRPNPPARTITVNHRRYATDRCQHRGPYVVDRTLATVECGDCGAALNPLFCLEMLATHEAYWNARSRDLQKYLLYLNKEIEGRTRTKCTHCGNMTAIRFTCEPPRTWVPQPEY